MGRAVHRLDTGAAPAGPQAGKANPPFSVYQHGPRHRNANPERPGSPRTRRQNRLALGPSWFFGCQPRFGQSQYRPPITNGSKTNANQALSNAPKQASSRRHGWHEYCVRETRQAVVEYRSVLIIGVSSQDSSASKYRGQDRAMQPVCFNFPEAC